MSWKVRQASGRKSSACRVHEIQRRHVLERPAERQQQRRALEHLAALRRVLQQLLDATLVDVAVKGVHGDLHAGGEHGGGDLGVEQRRDAVLPRQRSQVAGRGTDIGDERRRAGQRRGEPRRGGARDEHRARREACRILVAAHDGDRPGAHALAGDDPLVDQDAPARHAPRHRRRRGGGHAAAAAATAGSRGGLPRRAPTRCPAGSRSAPRGRRRGAPAPRPGHR